MTLVGLDYFDRRKAFLTDFELCAVYFDALSPETYNIYQPRYKIDQESSDHLVYSSVAEFYEIAIFYERPRYNSHAPIIRICGSHQQIDFTVETAGNNTIANMLAEKFGAELKRQIYHRRKSDYDETYNEFKVRGFDNLILLTEFCLAVVKFDELKVAPNIGHRDITFKFDDVAAEEFRERFERGDVMTLERLRAAAEPVPAVVARARASVVRAPEPAG